MEKNRDISFDNGKSLHDMTAKLDPSTQVGSI